MNKDTHALLLRAYIGESDMYNGQHAYRHLIKLLRKEGIAGVTVLRGVAGFGKKSRLHTDSIERLSVDLPILIEIVDTQENIERIKPLIAEVVTEGLITEEKVKILFYEGKK